MLKNRLTILLASFLVLVSCAKTDMLSGCKGDSISYRTSVEGGTRNSDGDFVCDFWVKAYTTGDTPSPYLLQYAVATQCGLCQTEKKYHWPDGDLDFYAYSFLRNWTETDMPDWNEDILIIGAYTPDDPGCQGDLVVAHTRTNQEASANGVPLNFKHAQSQVRLAVRNSLPWYSFDVYGWAIYNFDNEAWFDFSGTFEEDGRVKYSDWLQNESGPLGFSYLELGKEYNIGPLMDEPLVLSDSWGLDNMILIPQKTFAASSYKILSDEGYDYSSSSYRNEVAVDGTCIVVSMAIYNEIDGSLIREGICIWPVSLDLAPGMSYTYIIDLAEGGYYPNWHCREFEGELSSFELDPVLFTREMGYEVEVGTWESEPVEPSQPAGFSVSDSKRIKFAPGNLWCNASVNPIEWHFENEQFEEGFQGDYSITPYSWEGGEPVDCREYSPSSSHITKFRYTITDYGTSSFYQTMTRSVDWGVPYCLSNGLPEGTWRMLSNDELEYLLKERRASAVNGVLNARFFTGRVLLPDHKPSYGLFILPDFIIWPDELELPDPSTINNLTSAQNWRDNINSYNLDAFRLLERCGVAFIPSTGYCGFYPADLLSRPEVECQYWLNGVERPKGKNDWYNIENVYVLAITSKDVTEIPMNSTRGWTSMKCSVRLVSDMEE